MNGRIVIIVTVPAPDDDMPAYVHVLSGGTVESAQITLDARTLRELASQVLEIEEARAAAAVSGRDYVIR